VHPVPRPRRRRPGRRRFPAGARRFHRRLEGGHQRLGPPRAALLVRGRVGGAGGRGRGGAPAAHL
ncbi:MAG: hypothetical protein AVDCRST_MAG04-2888, partial [uncultured Acetobacteraceae bacterium]